MCQPRRPDPRDLLVLARSDRPVPLPAEIKWHQKVKRIVSVACERKRRQAGLAYVDAKLLKQFTAEPGLGRLSRVHLAARELPQSGHGFAVRAAGDQYAIIVIDKRGGGDKKDLSVHVRGIAGVSPCG